MSQQSPKKTSLLSNEELVALDALQKTIIDSYLYDELEVELRAGLGLEKFDATANMLLFPHYRRILSYLDKAVEEKRCKKVSTDSSRTLDISLATNEKNMAMLRFTVKENDIKKHCEDDVLPLNHKVIFKGQLPNTELLSYRIRMGGKVELERQGDLFPISSPGLQSTQTKATDAYQKFVEKRDAHADGFRKMDKMYRLKDRVSYDIPFKNGLVIRIDLTKVKETVHPVTRFIFSDIIEQDERYEFEMEWIGLTQYLRDMGEGIRDNELSSLIDEFLSTWYHPIMEYVYEMPTFMSWTMAKEVKKLYTEVVRAMVKQRVHHKVDSVDDYQSWLVASEEKKKEIEDKYLNEFDYFNLLRKHVDPRKIGDHKNEVLKGVSLNEFSKWTIQDPFLGPKLTSLSVQDILPNNPDSIQYNYSVTDKADGLGMLWFDVGNDFSDLDMGLENIALEACQNRVFLLDNNLRVFDTGIVRRRPNASQKPTILNGEYIYAKNRYMIFDAYLDQGKDIMNLPLMKMQSQQENVPSRLGATQKYLASLGHDAEGHVDIQLKKFMVPTGPHQTIFSLTKDIWERKHEYDYRLDGTIYTPIDRPVMFSGNENFKYDLRLRTETKDKYYISMSGTWPLNYKWKPAADNTIDFLIRFDKKKVAQIEDKVLYKDDCIAIKHAKDGSIKNYVKAKLMNGSLLQPDITQPGCYVTATEARYKANKGQPLRPAVFTPNKPFEEHVGIPYFEMQSDYSIRGGKSMVKDQEGHPVSHNTIVECSYSGWDPLANDYQSDAHLRWNIVRTRHDKTFSYHMGTKAQKEAFRLLQLCLDDSHRKKQPIHVYTRALKYLESVPIPSLQDEIVRSTIEKPRELFHQYASDIYQYIRSYEDIKVPGSNLTIGNKDEVAGSIWSNIHNPVTEEMITTGKGIPTDDDVYYRSSLHKREDSALFSMKEFHNKTIKSQLLYRVASNYLRINGDKSIHLLDVGCGKGGDLPKWRDHRITNVVAIDESRDNLFGAPDNACSRYKFYKGKNMYDANKKLLRMPKVVFLQGDASKSISQKQCFRGESLRLSNRLWLTERVTLIDSFRDYSQVPFDMVSYMFSIHYFFASEATFQQLIQNIDENLRSGGILIGACFDGDTVFEALRQVAVNQRYVGESKRPDIWHLVKKYTEVEPLSEKPFGRKIGNFCVSIGQVIDEYLVCFKTLEDALAQKGIELMSQEDMALVLANPTLPASGQFHEYYDSSLQMKQVEKEYSFMNRYFIFRRKTDVERQRIEKELEYQQIVDKITSNVNANYKINLDTYLSSMDEADATRLEQWYTSWIHQKQQLLQQQQKEPATMPQQPYEKQNIATRKPIKTTKRSAVSPRPIKPTSPTSSAAVAKTKTSKPKSGGGVVVGPNKYEDQPLEIIAPPEDVFVPSKTITITKMELAPDALVTLVTNIRDRVKKEDDHQQLRPHSTDPYIRETYDKLVKLMELILDKYIAYSTSPEYLYLSQYYSQLQDRK